ncbi:U2 small nuclear ribonucleoprotein A' [Pleurotus pulmonarius]
MDSSLGTRISLAGNIGTVKFVGNVQGTSGIWLGIEWDDPTRGKHDGVHNEKSYFNCSIPNSGSFIRPTAQNLSYGVSFLQALSTKYVEQLHGVATQEKVILGSSNGSIEVEGPHLDKIRTKLARLDRLRDVSLDGEKVARADPGDTIRRTCSNIRNLDLSHSLLPSWDVVAAIVAELHGLQSLALNHNRLQQPSDLAKMAVSFQHLEELQLNATLTSWSAMLDVIRYTPKLRFLEMGYNRLTLLETSSVTSDDMNECVLQSLNLDSNECKDWPAVCKAMQIFPSLQRLLLSSNGIAQIPSPAEGQSDILQGLHHLALPSNLLCSWNDIDALSRWCPGLRTLALGLNPFVVGEAHARYSKQVTVALMPSLVILDGVNISAKERVDCELFYLSYVAKNGFQSHLSPADYPRWQELCAKHGEPSVATNNIEASGKLSTRLIGIQVYQYSEPPARILTVPARKPDAVIQVLPTMTLRMLRNKIAKSLKANRKTATLWTLLDEGTITVELGKDEDGHSLDWLGIENDSQMIVVLG